MSDWTDARAAAAILLHAPHEIGGVVVRASPGPVLETWLDLLRAGGVQLRRMPPSIPPDRLLGGLDLAATLAEGRAVAQRGLLAEAHGGLILAPMAERLERATASALAQALDTGRITTEREGLAFDASARFGVVALDESREDEPGVATILSERLGLHLDLRALSLRDLHHDIPDAGAEVPDALAALVATAAAFGIRSLRAPRFALIAARALASVEGREGIHEVDLSRAVRLVLAPRALSLPMPEETEPEEAPDNRDDAPPEDGADDQSRTEALTDMMIEAVRAVLPENLLDATGAQRGTGDGAAGGSHDSLTRGRPMPSRPGMPGGGARLDILASLRAAAPWQRLRGAAPGERPLRLRKQDFRIRRFRQPSESALVFIVDASGSAAAQRLAEAKGAVELLLGEAYARRDRIALITLRGEQAELSLPPTRALAAAKKRLTGLPGGGGTPLAHGVEIGLATALDAKRRGMTPTLVLLTDGKANIARDGTPGRARAQEDAEVAARAVRAAGIEAILLDTAPRPSAQAAALASAMAARYAPLPRADARTLSETVRQVAR